ncbi:MAG: amino acid-binding protein [Aquificae bacterium]|nr:amino acid-binding protein [Aquificota bacterium]
MRYYILSAVGEDQPGIVAGISEVLYKKGFNIENSAMTRLNNEFAVMLVVASEDTPLSTQDFERLSKEKGLFINIKPVEYHQPEDSENEKEIYNIVVYGADKPGIVYNVAKLLADRGINIVDLRTEKSPSLYVLIAQVEFPKGLTYEDIAPEIDRLKDELDIDISVEKVESVEM